MTDPLRLHVDSFSVAGRGFVVHGWAWDDPARPAMFHLRHPAAGRFPVRPVRYPRHDVMAALTGHGAPPLHTGFVAYCPIEAAKLPPDGWHFQMGAAEYPCEPALFEADAVRTRLLALADLESGIGPMIRNHLAPALEQVQRALTPETAVRTVEAFGTIPAHPPATVIVPLYGRFDFVEHQFCQFARDAELKRADLVYVLDSPELHEPERERFRQLHGLYRLPARLLTLTRNGGYSTANNLAAAFARSESLLLLNSDVFPDRAGWLGAMLKANDSGKRIVGAKLLYEDDGLQHAGMYYCRPSPDPVWHLQHFFKGMHRSISAANVARAVPAVTGACALIGRDLYDDVGGFDGGYVLGDYEDSDLCLRVRAAGGEVWYAPEAELYHLEGQSYPSRLRAAASRVNAALHTQRWDAAIRALPGSHR